MGPTETFVDRQVLDPKRQTSQRAVFTSLVNALAQVAVPHPYELSYPARAHLLSAVPTFASLASTWHAALETQHLFRLCAIGSVVRGSGWRFRTSDEEAYDALFARYHTSGLDWVPLSWFASGVLQNYRGFTWWSSLDLTGPELWNLWRRVGLLDNWIVHQSVILRCRSDQVRAMVPSCVDAFEGPVFESAYDRPDPGFGRTIDLSCQPFAPGVPEYVLPALPTASIDVRPVLVTKSMKAQGVPVVDAPPIWASLHEYYDDLVKT